MKRIAIFALLAAAPLLAQNTFRGNNAHTGVYPGAGPKQPGGVKWTFKRAASSRFFDGICLNSSLFHLAGC